MKRKTVGVSLERAKQIIADSDRKLYSTLTNWDELDEALSLIGAKKVKSSSFGSDWGDGDIDIFTRNVYDFSNVTIN